MTAVVILRRWSVAYFSELLFYFKRKKKAGQIFVRFSEYELCQTAV